MDNYHIYDVITSSKKSTIYKARKKQTLHYVAAKKSDKEELGRLRNSIAALHLMDHINIMRFEAWYSTPKHVWSVLEYCAGGDLATIVSMDGALPPEAVRLFAADLVSALLHVHSKGFLMGEIRPSGVLLDENGTLKIADFSVSQRVDDVSLLEKSRTASTALQYTAPELLLLNPDTVPPHVYKDSAALLAANYGSADAQATAVFSRSSDLYSIGVVLLELATGMRPYTSHDVNDIIANIILASPLDAPAMLPAVKVLQQTCPALLALCAGLLAKDPLKRFGWSDVLSHTFWHGNDDNAIIAAGAVPPVAIPHTCGDLPLESWFEAYRGNRRPLPSLLEESTGKGASCDISSIPDSSSIVTHFQQSPKKEEPPSVLPDDELPHVARVLELDASDYPQNLEAASLRADNMSYPLADYDPSADFADSLLHDRQHDITTTSSLLDESSITQTEHETEWRSIPAAGYDSLVRAKPHDTTVPGEVVRVSADASKLSEAVEEEAEGEAQEVDWSILIAPYDRQVEPIAGVRIPHVPAVRQDDLPFRPFMLEAASAPDVAERRTQMQNHLTEVYRGMVKGDHGIQLNILSYCFQAVVDKAEIANWMVNSSLLRVLLKLIENSSSAGVQARAAVLLGMIVRQATIIVCKVVYEGGLLDTLLRMCGANAVSTGPLTPTRRYCISAMAELLFYISTQVHKQRMAAVGAGSSSADNWSLPGSVSSYVAQLIRTFSEDTSSACRDVVQLIINVCSMAPMALSDLVAGESMLRALLDVSTNADNSEMQLKALQAFHLVVHVTAADSCTPHDWDSLVNLHNSAAASIQSVQTAVEQTMEDRHARTADRRIAEIFNSLKRAHGELYWVFTASCSLVRLVTVDLGIFQQHILDQSELLMHSLQLLEEHVALFTKYATVDLYALLVVHTAKCLAACCIAAQSAGGLAPLVDDARGMQLVQGSLDTLLTVHRCQRIFTIHDENAQVESASEYLAGLEDFFSKLSSQQLLHWLRRGAGASSLGKLLALVDRLVDDAQHTPNMYKGLLKVDHLSAATAWLADIDDAVSQRHLLRLIQLILGFLAINGHIDIPQNMGLYTLDRLSQLLARPLDGDHQVLTLQLMHQVALCTTWHSNRKITSKDVRAIMSVLRKLRDILGCGDSGMVSVALACVHALFARATLISAVTSTECSSLVGDLLKQACHISTTSPSGSDASAILDILSSETARSFSAWSVDILTAVNGVFRFRWRASLADAVKVYEIGIDLMFFVRSRPADGSGDAGAPASVTKGIESLLVTLVPAGIVGLLEMHLTRKPGKHTSDTTVLLEFLVDFARLFPHACAAALSAWTTTSAQYADELVAIVSKRGLQCSVVYRAPLDALDALFPLLDGDSSDKLSRLLGHACSASVELQRLVASIPSLQKHVKDRKRP